MAWTFDPVAAKAEITTGPSYAAAYAAKDVNTLQAIYNAVTVNGVVDRFALLKWVASNNLRGTIEDISANAAHPLRSSALALVDVIRGATSGLDLADPDNITMLNAWVSVGVLTAAQESALIALSQTPRTASVEQIASALYNPDGSVK